MDLNTQRMRLFYNIFPYPNRSIFAYPVREYSLIAHAGFASQIAQNKFTYPKLIWEKRRFQSKISFLSNNNDKEYLHALEGEIPLKAQLLLVGCGTDEPLLFHALHPKNKILGIDLSFRSIFIAKIRLILAAIRKFRRVPVALKVADACEFLTKTQAPQFFFIQCYGVLMAQADPRNLFRLMTTNLQPNGFLRLMIYTRKGRAVERWVQRQQNEIWEQSANKTIVSSLMLWWSSFKLQLWQIKNLLLDYQGLGARFRYIGLSRSHLADSFLHPAEPGMEPSLLTHWAEEFGLDLIFCEAKIYEQGWLAGFGKEECIEKWKTILSAENKNNLESNIVVIFQKKLSK